MIKRIIINALSLLLVGISFSATADISGYSYDRSSYVDFQTDEIVEGDTVTVYDYDRSEYRDVVINDADQDEVNVTYDDTGETETVSVDQ